MASLLVAFYGPPTHSHMVPIDRFVHCHRNCVGFEYEAYVAIGEMNFASLTQLGERGLGAYRGPLILTGQDILTQREIVFSGAGKKIMFGKSTGRYTNA